MTPADFRRLALSLAGAQEATHGGHADFRLGKRIFATLGYPDDRYGMVKLSLTQRDILLAAEPSLFSAVPGGWGKNGATLILLAPVGEAAALAALRMARDNLAKQVRRRPTSCSPAAPSR